MVTKNKAAVPLSMSSIQFLQTSGLSLMIQSSAPHLCVSPLSFFSFCFFFILCYHLVCIRLNFLLFLGGVHQLLAIPPFYKASRIHTAGFALLCTGTAGASLRQLGFI